MISFVIFQKQRHKYLAGIPIALVKWGFQISTDLTTAHTPISAESSNSVVFRLQPVYFLSTSCILVDTYLNCIDLSSKSISTHDMCFYKDKRTMMVLYRSPEQTGLHT